MNSDSYNLGKESLDFLFKTLKIDKEWSARNETSFDWWAHKLKQKIWFNSDIEDEGLFLTKICAETDLIINVDIESATQILEIIQPLGLLAAPIYDENDKSIKLYSHIYVHKESVGWLQELFTYVAIIQCTLAHNLINILNDRFHNNITIDESSHPDNGKRNAGDDMLNIISHIIIPAGENESPWSDTLEFGEISKMCNNFGLFSAGEMDCLV
jgi:hypothetical protein